MPSSLATSYVTGTGAALMPPGLAGSTDSGSGARRVHNTKPSAAGAPDATTSENGSPFSQFADCPRARPMNDGVARADAAMPADFNNVRRVKRYAFMLGPSN